MLLLSLDGAGLHIRSLYLAQKNKKTTNRTSLERSIIPEVKPCLLFVPSEATHA